jgi:hypothetical protein
VNAYYPGESKAIGGTGNAEHCVAGVLGGIERQKQNEESKAPAGKVKILQRVVFASLAAEPAKQQERTKIA